MPYLLILISFIFVSCGKKENAVSQLEVPSALDQRAFIIVKHDDGKSAIRGKILNQFVEEKLPSIDSSIHIEKRDELIGGQLDERDLISYASSEEKMAKIVVSFSDHEEIYFIPQDVPLNSVQTMLHLKPEADKIFKWIKTDMYSTFAGASFYLASVNLNDVIANDQKFYEESLDLNSQYMNSSLKLATGKTMEFTFNYNVYLQREVAASFIGRSSKCTPDMNEAGMCGRCTYNRNVASGDFDKIAFTPAELGLLVRVGSQTLTTSQLVPEIVNANQFKIVLNANDFDISHEVTVNLDSMAVTPIEKVTAGYNYSDTCQARSERAGITLSRRLDVNVSVKVSGRGAEVLKNIL